MSFHFTFTPTYLVSTETLGSERQLERTFCRFGTCLCCTARVYKRPTPQGFRKVYSSSKDKKENVTLFSFLLYRKIQLFVVRTFLVWQKNKKSEERFFYLRACAFWYSIVEMMNQLINSPMPYFSFLPFDIITLWKPCLASIHVFPIIIDIQALYSLLCCF